MLTVLGILHFLRRVNKTPVFLLRRSEFLELESTLLFLWRPHQLFNCFAGGGRRRRTDCRGRATDSSAARRPGPPPHQVTATIYSFPKNGNISRFIIWFCIFELVCLVGVWHWPGAVQWSRLLLRVRPFIASAGCLSCGAHWLHPRINYVGLRAEHQRHPALQAAAADCSDCGETLCCYSFADLDLEKRNVYS